MNEVIFNKDNGNIIVNKPYESWQLTKRGHVNILNNIKRTNSDGGISSEVLNESKAIVKTYTHNEVKVELVNKEDSVSTLYLRVSIGFDNFHLLILSNQKCYITTGSDLKVHYDEEMNPKEIFYNFSQIKNQLSTMGSVTNLKTSNSNTIVDAINELSKIVSSSRQICGYGEWLILNNEVLEKFTFRDLDIGYRMDLRKWQYYSEALKEWTDLPIGWQKATRIIRLKSELFKIIEPNVICGVLETNELYKHTDGNWVIEEPFTDKPGDEYIMRFIIGKDYNGDKSGTIVYTPRGYVYLVN